MGYIHDRMSLRPCHQSLVGELLPSGEPLRKHCSTAMSMLSRGFKHPAQQISKFTMALFKDGLNQTFCFRSQSPDLDNFQSYAFQQRGPMALCSLHARQERHHVDVHRGCQQGTTQI